MNPFEWFAAIYGKWFVGSPVLGYAVIVLCAAVLLLPLWILGIDKYNTDHPAQSPPDSLHEGAGIQMSVSASVVRGDLTHARPMLREQLAAFIGRGEQIKTECLDDRVSDADVYAHGEQWSEETQEFLDGHMGTDYHDKFAKAEMSPADPLIQPISRTKGELWKSVHQKITYLKEFLREVQE